MLKKIDIDGLSHRLANALCNKADAVMQANPEILEPLCFHYSELENENLVKEKIQSLLGKKMVSIYAIRLLGQNPNFSICSAVSNLKGKETARAYPRVNEVVGQTSCLYVGKSRNTAKRIYEHLVEANPKTYAMHMKHWSKDMGGIIQVDIFKYEASIDEDCLQLLEDRLAFELNPMLGRRGAK